ncbi:MAG: Ig-like domain-containing protein [Candidatus Zixiibacteriota bacterium]|nr:MAG: Ig-like domain-containing protein [candidate division Zixibacteria bacterium]
MRTTSRFIVMLLGAIALTAFFACRGDLPTTTEYSDMADAPSIQSVFPQNGARNISRNISYYIKFDHTMDTASVSDNFHLVEGGSMQDWLHSYRNGLGEPGAGHQRMIDWLDSIECAGRMEWNPDCDSCRFDPDSLLMPETDYVVFFRGGACDSSGTCVKTDHLPYGGYMYHFRTRQ